MFQTKYTLGVSCQVISGDLEGARPWGKLDMRKMWEEVADWILVIESTADEMDNLQAVTLGERDVGPATSRSDLPVEFHSDPVAF